MVGLFSPLLVVKALFYVKSDTDVFGELWAKLQKQHQNPPHAWKKDLVSGGCENRQEWDTERTLISSSLFTVNLYETQ